MRRASIKYLLSLCFQLIPTLIPVDPGRTVQGLPAEVSDFFIFYFLFFCGFFDPFFNYYYYYYYHLFIFFIFAPRSDPWNKVVVDDAGLPDRRTRGQPLKTKQKDQIPI